jgi:hypothetical protein
MGDIIDIPFKLLNFEGRPYLCLRVNLQMPGNRVYSEQFLTQALLSSNTYTSAPVTSQRVQQSQAEATRASELYSSGKVDLKALIDSANARTYYGALVRSVPVAQTRQYLADIGLGGGGGGGGGAEASSTSMHIEAEQPKLTRFFNLNSLIPSSTELILIAEFKGRVTFSVNELICVFTLRKSESIFELYDLQRNLFATPYKGKISDLLKAYLEILKSELPPAQEIILWLGTVEQSLAVNYSKNGFTLCSDELQAASSGMSLPPPTHTISPLGCQFPTRGGWSFTYPLYGQPVLASPTPLLRRTGLEVPVTDLQLGLTASGLMVDIHLECSATITRRIYHDLIMGENAETTLVFAETMPRLDKRIRWHGNHFSADPGMNSATMIAHTLLGYGDILPMFTESYGPDFTSRYVTGHTHPAILYVKDAQIVHGKLHLHSTRQQDISFPSLGDYRFTLGNRSPLHLVCTPECVYSLTADHTVLAGCTERQSQMLLSDHFSTEFNRIASLSLLSHAFWDVALKTEFTSVLRQLIPAGLGGGGPANGGGGGGGGTTYALPPVTQDGYYTNLLPGSVDYRRFKMAKLIFIRDKLNQLLTLDGVCLSRVRLHFYRKTGDLMTGLWPAPICRTSRPRSLLVSDQSLVKKTGEVQEGISQMSSLNITAATRRLTASAAAGGGGGSPVAESRPTHIITTSSQALKELAKTILVALTIDDFRSMTELHGFYQQGLGRRVKRRKDKKHSIRKRKNTVRRKKSRRNKH